jgi:hypothetical protein
MSLKRAGCATYMANAVMARKKESFLCFGDHFEDVFTRVVDILAELTVKERDRYKAVKFYRWNGVSDAGEWVINTSKTIASFEKQIATKKNKSS